MFKNNRNKFMASAAAVALVATAVVPVAGAEVSTNADASYLDVNPLNTHTQNIYKALDYKIMMGYPNNTFKPEKKLTRSDVVKVLGKYVLAKQGKTLADVSLADYKDVVPFKDVPSTSSELYTYSLIVKDAKIFSGSNNNLMAENLINRMQLAKVLVNAFGLKDLPGNLSKVTDNASAQEEFRTYINILSENGITTESIFRPKETTSRSQLASFAVRGYEKAHGIQTPAQAVTAFEKEMGGFVSLGKEFGFNVKADAAKDNTFNISVSTEVPEEGEVGGTGFFQSMADQGIEKASINGTVYTISDGEGTVSPGAAAAKEAIRTAITADQTVKVTVEIPYGNGTAVTKESYTFNFIL